jgi:hypothetical protein
MAYVQQFKPRGSDLDALNFFMRNRLTSVVEEPEQQSHLAYKVYDLARSTGVKPGNMSVRDLDAALNMMMRGQEDPGDVGTRVMRTKPASMGPVTGDVNYGGDLLPRAGLQSPLEAFRPVRYFHQGDAAADAIGTTLYHFVDSLTLGLLGGAGGIFKRLGAKENFWTESIGGQTNLLGMDFGAGGIAKPDTAAGEWFARAGEFAGFMAPVLATGGAGLAAAPFKKMANKALLESGEALVKSVGTTGPKKLYLEKMAEGAGLKAAGHARTAARITAAGQAQAEFLKKMPANLIFEKGHALVRKMFVGEIEKGLSSQVLTGTIGASGAISKIIADAVGSGTITQGTADVMGAVLGANIKKGAAQAATRGFVAAEMVSPNAIKAATVGKVGAAEIEEAIVGNADVLTAAKQVFQSRIGPNVARQLGLNLDNEAHKTLWSNIVKSADDVFTESFKNSRRTGLLSLQEVVAKRGEGVLGMTAARIAQNTTGHVVNMALLGLVRRVADPIASPRDYGIDEQDDMKAMGQVAKYWVRGAKVSPFEGIMGDIFVGSMFGTAGGLRLIPALQRNRIAKPQETMSIMAGGNPDNWGIVMDKTDAALSWIYESAKRMGGQKGAAPWRSFMRRNKVDFRDLAENNRAGFIQVAKNYMQYLENNPSVMQGRLPFGIADLNMASKLSANVTPEMEKRALDKIVGSMSSHFDKWMNDYTKTHGPALLKDMAQMALLTTSTSFASAPELWLKYAEGDSEIHPADLVMHTLFAGMMSRTPYFVDGANPYIAAHASGKPMTKEMQNIQLMMRAKDSLRRLGIRDSSLILTGDDGMVPDLANSPSPLRMDAMVNESAQSAMDESKAPPTPAGQQPSWTPVAPRFEVEGPGKPAGGNIISYREVTHFVKWLRARIASGADVSDILTNPDKTSTIFKSGTLTEEALKSDPHAIDILVNTLGRFKEKLVSEKIIQPDEQFGYEEMTRAEDGYYREMVAKVSRLISTGGKGNGIQKMLTEFAASKDGRREGISYIEGMNTEGNADLQRMVDAYNEFVKIAQDFGSVSVEMNGTGTPIPTIVDFKNDPAKAKELENLVVSMSDVLQTELGLPSLNMGSGKMHRALVEGLLSSRLEHSVILGHDGGTLFTRDGQHVSIKTFTDWLVESGAGFVKNEGAGDVIVTRLVDLTGYEDAAGGDRPMKADIIRNVLRYLEATGKVTVRWYKEGDEGTRIGKDTFDKFFSSSYEMYDSRGDRKFVRQGGLDTVAREIGMNFDYEDVTNAMIRQLHKARNSKVSEVQWRLIDLLKQVGLYRKDKFGRAVMMMAARAEADNRVGEMDLGFDITRLEYQDIVDQLAQNHLRPLLDKADFDFLMKEVKELSDAGVLRLSMPEESFEGGGVSPGTFVVVGDAHEPIMKHFVEEIQNLRMRTTEEMFSDFTNTIRALETGIKNADLKGAGGKSWKNRRANMIKLVEELRRFNTIAPSFFMRADKIMLDEGILKIGKGFKEKKLFVPSNKELLRMIDSVDKFFADELHRTTRGDIVMEMMDAQQYAAELRAREAKKPRSDRHSLGEFMIGSGLAMSDASHTEALEALRTAPQAAASLSRGNAGLVDYVRGRLNAIVDSRYVGRMADRMKENIGEYSDNYILSLIEEAQTTPQKLIKMERGSAYPEVMRGGGGIGEVPRKVGVEIKERGNGEAFRTNYTIEDRLVMASSRDNEMNRYGDWAFVDSDSFGVRNPTEQGGGAERFQKLRNLAFSKGFDAMRRRLPNGGVAQEGFGRAILIREMRQGGGHKAFAVPDNITKATRFLAQARQILALYGEHIGSGSEIGDPLVQLRFIVENFQELMAAGDRAIEDFSIRGAVSDARRDINDALPSRIDMWDNVFTFLQMHEYFGQETLIRAFNEAREPGKDPLWKLVVRAGLANNGRSIVTIPSVYDASMRSFVDDARSGVTWGDVVDRMGMTVDENGSLRGYRALVYDNVAAMEATGRPLPEASGGIFMHPALIESMWHSKGFEVLSVRERADLGDGVYRTVMKVRFYDRTRGLLITKDVVSANPRMVEFMERNNVSMLMTRDSIKELGGEWENLVEDATARFPDGGRDLVERINRGTDGDMIAEPMEIPLESAIWTHPIDNEVTYASRSPQLASMRTAEQVSGMVADVYSKIGGIVSEFAQYAGLRGHTPAELMSMHYMYVRDEGAVDSMERNAASGAISSYYVRQGGPFATGMHYGRNRQALEVLKNKIISDKLLKMRTANGTQAVYVSDTYRTLRPGEAVAPAQFGNMYGDLYDMHVGFRLGEDFTRDAEGNTVVGPDQRPVTERGADRARAANREIHGWDGEDRFNDDTSPRGTPQERAIANDRESDIVHVPLWQGGRGGIWRGLMEMRVANRQRPERSSHEQRSIRRAMIRRSHNDAMAFAEDVNNAWQTAMRAPEADAVVEARIRRSLASAGRIDPREMDGVVREIMASRQALIGGVNLGVPGADAFPWRKVSVNGSDRQYIQNGAAHRALASLFGEYVYGETRPEMTTGQGYVDFGLTTMAQRHPSSMVSDSIVLMVRQILDPQWGNQVFMSHFDGEMKSKADQDEDHMHLFGDYKPGDISGALRNRETTPGFTEVSGGQVRARDFFRKRVATAGREGAAKDIRGSFVDEVVDNLDRGKAGIGIVSKAIATTSSMLYKEMAMSYRYNGQLFAVAPNAAYQNGELVFTTDQFGETVMDRVQQDRGPLDRVTELQNKYLDAKKVRVGEDPRKLDLQMDIMSEFYGLFVQDPFSGQWRRVTEGVRSQSVAQEILVGMASPLYQISSLGKDTITAEGGKQKKYGENLMISSRYDTVHGPDVVMREQAIADYVARHLVNELSVSITRRDQKLAGGQDNQRLREAVSDLAVITPLSSLNRRTIYDAMSEGILRSEQALSGKARESYLTDEEVSAFQQMQKFARVASPELKTADAARFVANYMDMPNVYKEMDRRRRNGERMLAAEAGAARHLLKQSDDYWRATENEAAFDRGTRLQPENQLEALEAQRDAVDATGINVARTMVSAYDRAAPPDRKARLEEAYAIRRMLSADFAEVLGSRESNADPRMWKDQDTVRVRLHATIGAYLNKWGREGNGVAAALDLMVPMILGKYTDSAGVNRIRYKKFNPMVLDSIISHMAFGGDMAVERSPTNINILGNNGSAAELMKIMAMSANLAEATMTHNPDAVSRVSAINEMVQTNGRSMLGALHLRDLQGSRGKKMMENVLIASINSEMSRMMGEHEGTPFDNTATNQFGFPAARDAERFLRDAITGRGEPMRVRLVHESHLRPSIIPEYLRTDFDDALGTFSIYKQVDATLGTNENMMRRGIKERIMSEENKKPRNKRRNLTADEMASEVRKIESKMLREALATIDATKQPKVRASTSDIYMTDIVQHQRRLRAERRNGRVC